MKYSILINSIVLFFILLLLYTGIEKLIDIHSFKEQLAASPLLKSTTGFIAWALPITEIGIAVALFIPAWCLRGLYATLVLMILFTAYIIILQSIDNHLSCSCGGIIEDLSPKQHLLFNTACIILSIVGIIVLRRQQPSARFKWITSTSALFLFLLVGWTLSTAFSTPGPVKTGLEGQLLPSFNLVLSDSVTRLNTDDIPSGKPIIMIGFSPFCVHCQKETGEIIKHIQQFKDMRIYLVTPFPLNDTKGFAAYFKLAKYPNITLGLDTGDYFLRYFKSATVPYTAIYDSKKRLKTVMPGKTDINQLLKVAAE